MKKRKGKRVDKAAGVEADLGDGFMHNIDDEDHVSDELDTGDDESGSDVEKRPKFIKFRPEQMRADFQFKVGMEFCSLKQFKDTVIEYLVLNGRQLRFQKNDTLRVRVRCKENCGFMAYCSKVGRTHTYRLKTLSEKHTCGRVLNNKNARSKWIADIMVENSKTHQRLQ